MTSDSTLSPDAIPPAALAVRLATSYQASQALIVAAKLGIPDLLGAGALGSEEIARATETNPDSMHRFLRALAAFGLVKDIGSRKFELAQVGHALRSDVPNSVRPIVLLFGDEHFWQSFSCLQECLKTGKNAFHLLFGNENNFEYYEKNPELASIFDAGMSALSARTGPALTKAYDFSEVRRIVDVGGGHGKVIAAILRAYPRLKGTVFDLPNVVEGASPLLASEGVSDRCDVVAGNMFDAVPAGGDAYLLSHIIHDWDDIRAAKVLQACREAIPANGKVLILDRVMPEVVEPHSIAEANHLLDLTMMLRTPGGRERTANQFQALLSTAGLRLRRILPTEGPDSVVEAVCG